MPLWARNGLQVLYDIHVTLDTSYHDNFHSHPMSQSKNNKISEIEVNDNNDMKDDDDDNNNGNNNNNNNNNDNNDENNNDKALPP